MKLIRTYEEFIYKDEIAVKEPMLSDNPVDDSILSSKFDDKGSYIDGSGVIHIKNWIVY